MTDLLRAWGPAAAWAAVLFCLSALHGDAVEWVPSGTDLMLHAAAYSVLGAALAYGRSRDVRRVPHWALVLLGSAYGVSDEWHQSFVPGRFSTVSDWGADTVGVLLGYALTVALWNRVRASRVERADRQPEPPGNG